MTGYLEFPELPELGNITDGESAWDALAGVYACVNQANREILGRDERSMDLTGDLPDKLKEWLKKLHDRLKAIVAKIPDAVSFSLTVGMTISVAVNFTKPSES